MRSNMQVKFALHQIILDNSIQVVFVMCVFEYVDLFSLCTFSSILNLIHQTPHSIKLFLPQSNISISTTHCQNISSNTPTNTPHGIFKRIQNFWTPLLIIVGSAISPLLPNNHSLILRTRRNHIHPRNNTRCPRHIPHPILMMRITTLHNTLFPNTRTRILRPHPNPIITPPRHQPRWQWFTLFVFPLFSNTIGCPRDSIDTQRSIIQIFHRPFIIAITFTPVS
mmetsp:Transcript_29146/g.43481  ORF Transcript_29146/g.43481 Transcript_29146/m.43481 type:complete len:224 (+) Transcript_29146:291-962(+)